MFNATQMSVNKESYKMVLMLVHLNGHMWAWLKWICSWKFEGHFKCKCVPGRVAQSVTCLVTDAKLIADPGVASSIPARSHTFVEIDHEIISTVILSLPLNESFMKGCCQLQAKVCARLLVNCLFKLAQEKVWLGELTVPQ